MAACVSLASMKATRQVLGAGLDLYFNQTYFFFTVLNNC